MRDNTYWIDGGWCTETIDPELGLALAEVVFTDAQGQVRVVPAADGATVMETAKSNQVPGIKAECGGFMNCATCHVYVHPDDMALLPPVSETEDVMLDGVVAQRRPNSRLSCQLKLGEGSRVRVTTPPAQV